LIELVFPLHPMISETDGRSYQPSVVATPAADGHWEAWIEFVDRASGAILHSGVETHQADEADLRHWSSCLSDVYLQGALARARISPGETRLHRGLVRRGKVDGRREAPRLDPFEVFRQGEHVLRRELRLFKRGALRALIIKYGLNPAGLDLSALSRDQLIAFIATAVDAQYHSPRAA
jgi:hypothetical protein